MTLSCFERCNLGQFPTPVAPLPRLSKALGGAQIFIKRDDLTGLGLGGNKTRKLEFILGDALAQGCDTLISAGAVQSNHCRQTAAAAAQLGLECHLVLGGQAPPVSQGNLLLDQLFGATIHWAGERRKGEDIPAIYQQLLEQGRRPYTVPYGGSNELGAIAFAEAVRELNCQQPTHPFTHIVFASSSGGTHAGLMVGKQLFGGDYQLHGINIDKDAPGDMPFSDRVIELANQTLQKLDHDHVFSSADLILNSDYVGEGYAVIGNLERRAIRLTAQLEGILLDPVYTGRAMGGLIDLVEGGRIDAQSKVLFWHTGGAPALFAYASELELP